jgi:cardiolipin synthase
MRLRQQIPNLLTFGRVLAVPLCLIIMLLDPSWKAVALFVLFIAASVTDYLDGYLARKWNVVSTIGALFDPIADKLLVALMLVYLLVEAGFTGPLTAVAIPYAFVLPPHAPHVSALFLPIVVMLLRELYISGLREFLANRHITLPVSSSGKWKTALQMVTISVLLGLLAFEVAPPPLQCAAPFVAAFDAACGQVNPLIVEIARPFALPLLYISAILAFTSAVSYTRASWKHLN